VLIAEGVMERNFVVILFLVSLLRRKANIALIVLKYRFIKCLNQKNEIVVSLIVG